MCLASLAERRPAGNALGAGRPVHGQARDVHARRTGGEPALPGSEAELTATSSAGRFATSAHAPPSSSRGEPLVHPGRRHGPTGSHEPEIDADLLAFARR